MVALRTGFAPLPMRGLRFRLLWLWLWLCCPRWRRRVDESAGLTYRDSPSGSDKLDSPPSPVWPPARPGAIGAGKGAEVDGWGLGCRAGGSDERVAPGR